MTLSPADFVNRMNAFPGMPAPFAEVTERRIALWRVYISMRIQRGEPIVLGDRRDLLGYLFDELGAQSRSRAGFKPSLFSAQLALWAAGQGYAFHLGTARSRLDVLLERAPLHVVARALRARVAERLGISGLSQRDEETAVRLRPGLDTED